MEAGKEASEQQLQKKKKKKQRWVSRRRICFVSQSPKDLLRESIITNTDDSNKEKKASGVAENPEDVLAFSRSVNKIDSSLD